MELFKVLHAVKSRFTPTEQDEYKEVGIITAESLEEAYQKTQGDWNKHRSRSTSVGDIIVDQEGHKHLVAFVGFSDLTRQKMIDDKLRRLATQAGIVEKM